MNSPKIDELTEEQKAHIAVLRKKFFRFVSVFSVFFTIILLIILRFTVYDLKTVEDYEQYINDKDKFIRFNTAKALGKFKGEPRATRLLTQMLSDPAREVRWHAAASLSKLKDPVSTKKLLMVIDKESDASALSLYIYTLGQIKDEAALNKLRDILLNQVKLNGDINQQQIKTVRLSTIQALAAFDTKTSKQILLEFENMKNQPKELIEFSKKMRKTKGVPEKNNT